MVAFCKKNLVYISGNPHTTPHLDWKPMAHLPIFPTLKKYTWVAKQKWHIKYTHRNWCQPSLWEIIFFLLAVCVVVGIRRYIWKQSTKAHILPHHHQLPCFGMARHGQVLTWESDKAAANIPQENITTAKQTQSETYRTNDSIFLLDF